MAEPQCCFCFILPTVCKIKQILRKRYGRNWEKEWKKLVKIKRLVKGSRSGLKEYPVQERANNGKIRARKFYEISND